MKKSTKKRFFKFLKDEGIYWLWGYNVVRGQRLGWMRSKVKKPIDIICYSFSWIESRTLRDGNPIKFWLKVHFEWSEVVRKEELK